MKAKEAVANPLNFVLKTKFSSYYKVMMSSGQSYFVKRLNRSDIVLQLGCHENFRRELEALTKINSSNIMTPVAYMLASDGAYLFYKTAFKSTLFGVLHGSSGIPLDWASRCSIAVGLAQGLAYLHGCSSGPILLFDLSSSSVILKSLTEPQIGDIELCKLIDPSKNSSSLSAVAGSVGYIPPEYAYTMRVTTEGNVYSFGVILLELVTGKEAVSQGIELAKWALDNSTQPQKWEQMLDLSISRTSQTVRSQMLAMLKIAFACIDSSSLARPKMKSVLRMLLNAK
uniref:Protein kinase domain-containing protein n=1 Tax=Opuntia streptacantha TaxID=393608 RepID=A0A7C9A7N0_OPUST